jgi:hypothetical protein
MYKITDSGTTDNNNNNYLLSPHKRTLNSRVSIQTGNQFMYFRVNDPITNEMYYDFGPGTTNCSNLTSANANFGSTGFDFNSSSNYGMGTVNIKEYGKMINPKWDASKNNILSAGFFVCGRDKYINGRRVENNDGYLMSPAITEGDYHTEMTSQTDTWYDNNYWLKKEQLWEYIGYCMNRVNEYAMIKHTKFKKFNGEIPTKTVTVEQAGKAPLTQIIEDADYQKITNNTMYVYPSLTKEFGLCIDSMTDKKYLEIKPGDEILIPIKVEYCLPDGTQSDNIEKSMAFDLLSSLYSDPNSYSFQIIAKKDLTEADKVYVNSVEEANNSKYNVIYR